MPGQIRVIADENDPVVMDRLVRLLIAQAHIELLRKRLEDQVKNAQESRDSDERAS